MGIPASGSILLLTLAIAVPFTGCQQGLRLLADPGIDPGIVMDQFPPGRNAGDTSSVIKIISRGGFSGRLYVTDSCCWDVLSGLPFATPWKIAAYPASGYPSSNVSVGNPAMVTLKIVLTGYNVPTDAPPVPYGKYLMTVEAKGQDLPVRGSTKIALTVLPEKGFAVCSPNAANPNAPGYAPPYFEAGTSRLVLQLAITAAEKQPRETALPMIIVYTNRPHEVLRLKVRDSAFEKDSARVLLRNANPEGREIAVGCPGPPQRRSLRTAGGRSGSMVIRKATDRTLALRMPECAPAPLGICLSRTWVDIFVFADEGFWDAFGGRTLEFTWLHCTELFGNWTCKS